MNARQQQLINELTEEFNRLNSSNVNKGSILDIASYMGEFNESEGIRKEINAWNDIFVREANESFLEEAYQLKKDLIAMNIESTISEGGSFPSILIPYRAGEYIRIRLYYYGESIKLPNSSNVDKIKSASVGIGNYRYSSLKKLCDSNVDFKNSLREAIKNSNKNI